MKDFSGHSFKIRENLCLEKYFLFISKKTIDTLYVASTITWEGKKEVLGLWLDETEGAKFRIRSPRKADMYNYFLSVQGESLMSVLTDIKNRDDILIVCMDGLTGFPDTAKVVFPDTHIQHCIVHMIRNSTLFLTRI